MNQAAEEAARFIDESTEDCGTVLHVGPMEAIANGRRHTAVLFVSSPLAREMFEIDQEDVEALERISAAALRSILEVCLAHQAQAISGQTEGVQQDDFESVAEYVAEVGLRAAAQENLGYRGPMRLVQLEPDVSEQESRYWLILCKREQPERGEQTTLRLEMTLRGCRPETAADGELFRPLGKLLSRDGGPPGDLSFLFSAPKLASNPDVTVDELEQLEDEDYPEEGIRYLGCVSHTRSGLLCFFPGIPRGPFRLLTESGDIHESVDEGRLDHFTLLPDRNHWHLTGYTSDGARVSRGNFRTRRVSEGLVHWFSLGLRSGELLYKMREKNMAEFEVPARDEVRCRRASTDAIRNAWYGMTSVGDARDPDVESFWYLEVFVADGPGREPPREEFRAHGAVGESALPPGGPIDVASRRVGIGGTDEQLLVLATRLPGTMDTQVEIGFPVVEPS